MWDLLTHTCHNNLPLKCESIHSWICSPSSGSFLHPYTCTAVGHTQRDTPPDHLCQEDFRYKEPVEPFVEPSALIPLLGHHEGAATGDHPHWV
ncbi:hypothetical protein QL285_091318 [Trifolium repens]|nr:hypothetical protein QL285_091318 [Trifolium repens]